MTIAWRPLTATTRSEVPARLGDWLYDRQSLTQRIKRICKGGFEVQVANEGWQRPLPDEARALGLRFGSFAFIRQVYLVCDGHPWVFARTIIPRKTLAGSRRRLTNLGTRPLGDVLFSDSSTTRQTVAIAHIEPGNLPYMLMPPDSERANWGRRSVFRIRQKPLLVVELFLEGIVSHDCCE